MYTQRIDQNVGDFKAARWIESKSQNLEIALAFLLFFFVRLFWCHVVLSTANSRGTVKRNRDGNVRGKKRQYNNYLVNGY